MQNLNLWKTASAEPIRPIQKTKSTQDSSKHVLDQITSFKIPPSLLRSLLNEIKEPPPCLGHVRMRALLQKVVDRVFENPEEYTASCMGFDTRIASTAVGLLCALVGWYDANRNEAKCSGGCELNGKDDLDNICEISEVLASFERLICGMFPSCSHSLNSIDWVFDAFHGISSCPHTNKCKAQEELELLLIMVSDLLGFEVSRVASITLNTMEYSIPAHSAVDILLKTLKWFQQNKESVSCSGGCHEDVNPEMKCQLHLTYETTKAMFMESFTCKSMKETFPYPFYIKKAFKDLQSAEVLFLLDVPNESETYGETKDTYKNEECSNPIPKHSFVLCDNHCPAVKEIERALHLFVRRSETPAKMNDYFANPSQVSCEDILGFDFESFATTSMEERAFKIVQILFALFLWYVKTKNSSHFHTSKKPHSQDDPCNFQKRLLMFHTKIKGLKDSEKTLTIPLDHWINEAFDCLDEIYFQKKLDLQKKPSAVKKLEVASLEGKRSASSIELQCAIAAEIDTSIGMISKHLNFSPKKVLEVLRSSCKPSIVSYKEVHFSVVEMHRDDGTFSITRGISVNTILEYYEFMKIVAVPFSKYTGGCGGVSECKSVCELKVLKEELYYKTFDFYPIFGTRPVFDLPDRFELLFIALDALGLHLSFKSSDTKREKSKLHELKFKMALPNNYDEESEDLIAQEVNSDDFNKGMAKQIDSPLAFEPKEPISFLETALALNDAVTQSQLTLLQAEVHALQLKNTSLESENSKLKRLVTGIVKNEYGLNASSFDSIEGADVPEASDLAHSSYSKSFVRLEKETNDSFAVDPYDESSYKVKDINSFDVFSLGYEDLGDNPYMP